MRIHVLGWVAGVVLIGLLAGCQSNTASPTERTGLTAMRGAPLTLEGQPIEVGDTARPFTAVANDMSTFTFNPGSGTVWIITSVPSLDTSVCSTETHKFNEEAGQLDDHVKILTVSMDLPFAQKRWCGAEGVKNITTVSDYRSHNFGMTYGVLIKQNGLLARTVFVIDKTGKIVYEQIVPELTHEPDYAAAMAAAKKAAR